MVCVIIKGAVKKENKQIRNDRTGSTCLSQKVLFTSGNNQDFMKPEQTKNQMI